MNRVIHEPPTPSKRADGTALGGWWHEDMESGRIVCDLCPRACALKPGDRGFCFVRENRNGEMILSTYGRSTGFCIDPIEKKPLNHFYPGTSVLSFGTAGCNLGCKFCQNWDISKSREIQRLSEEATPTAIARAARSLQCQSVAFTYNDPVIWAEYAIDTARACHEAGLKTVAVTAGYITPEAREPFFRHMDAANVDLKAFTEEFYHKITYSHLQPVLDTLAYLRRETDVWFEITNLVIPGENDSMDEIRRMCAWILKHCGPETPLHFSAFHPDFRMMDRPATPPETLARAYDLARSEGLHYVYTGNVNDPARQSTYCPACGELLIERNWYDLGQYRMNDSHCGACGHRIAGRFAKEPGDWGRKRLPVDLGPFLDERQVVPLAPPSERKVRMNPPNREATAQLLALDAVQPEHLDSLLQTAREFVVAHAMGTEVCLSDPTIHGLADQPILGAYVTLKRNGRLRACCGSLGHARRLVEVLGEASRRTVLEDARLPIIAPAELPFLDIHVNILHGLNRVAPIGQSRVQAIEVGRHGLRIARGQAAGLLLPSVAVEHGLDAESFLRHVCRKAGLPSTAWEDEETTLWTFEALECGGTFGDLPGITDSAWCDRREFEALNQHAGRNVTAMVHRLTPDYYATGLADGMPSGITISAAQNGVAKPIHVTQLSLRPGVPLQATLFRLCESLAQALVTRGVPPLADQIGLTLFHAPAMHGTLANPDLRGFEPSRRALLGIDRDRHALVFDPAKTADELLGQLLQTLRPLEPNQVGLYSLAIQSSEPRLQFESIPTPIAGPPMRPPAVAGTFYPADATELNTMVDTLLSAGGRPSRASAWRAAMVPHAGLKYSGRLAADVLTRLEIPKRIIVLGPKHTRLGVDWAVAPHKSWKIPGAELSADPDLAHRLAEAIPGLRPDAAAHQKEHAIEVELPFLAKLAPNCQITGIVIGAGGWNACQSFAEGLSKVIAELDEPPLLLISSDMNHFATEAESYRLDELALAAMEARDPQHLLNVVREHDISMCGVLPAVIVMETLRRLGGLKTVQRIGHTTSAETTGETDRVVGYAGVLMN